VFAIAITLLVLEIGVPLDQFHHLWYAIGQQWPSYLAYATSFLTIGALWLAHHGIFRRMVAANQVIVRLNLALLLTASFLPFPTKLMAESLYERAGEHQSVLFYGGSLLVITTILGAMARYAARPALIADDEQREHVRALGRRINPNLGIYAFVICAAAFFPRVAVFGYLYVAVMAVMRNR
jgi:uncharacterized membrane protein